MKWIHQTASLGTDAVADPSRCRPRRPPGGDDPGARARRRVPLRLAAAPGVARERVRGLADARPRGAAQAPGRRARPARAEPRRRRARAERARGARGVRGARRARRARGRARRSADPRRGAPPPARGAGALRALGQDAARLEAAPRRRRAAGEGAWRLDRGQRPLPPRDPGRGGERAAPRDARRPAHELPARSDVDRARRELAPARGERGAARPHPRSDRAPRRARGAAPDDGARAHRRRSRHATLRGPSSLDSLMADRYLPIAEHGVIGDLHTVALVGTDGTIDWLCLPQFDSPSVFGSILDAERGGFFAVAPREECATKQLYFPDTNVLITRFLAPEGVGEVVDYMP